jgi:hypothetical protein
MKQTWWRNEIKLESKLPLSRADDACRGLVKGNHDPSPNGHNGLRRSHLQAQNHYNQGIKEQRRLALTPYAKMVKETDYCGLNSGLTRISAPVQNVLRHVKTAPTIENAP